MEVRGIMRMVSWGHTKKKERKKPEREADLLNVW